MHQNGSHPSARPAGPADDEISLRDAWNVVARNRLTIAACFAAVVAGTAALTLVTDPVWDAAASVRIDEDESALPGLEVLQSLSTGGSEVATEMEVLRSRSLAEEVVDSLGLRLTLDEPARTARERLFSAVVVPRSAPAATYEFVRAGDSTFRVADDSTGRELGTFRVGQPVPLGAATVTLAPTAAAEERIRATVHPFDETVRDVRAGIAVSRPNRDANIVVVRYQSTDQALVREVPNTLARRFIAHREQVRKTEARSTVRFLREQIAALSGQLTAAEEAMRAFREGQQVVNLGAEGTEQVGQLARLQAQRNELNAERAALDRLLADIHRAQVETPADAGAPSPYRRLASYPSLLGNVAVSQLLAALTQVENERAALLVRRTEKDPDVVALSQRIAELEVQLRTMATTYLEGLTNQVASLDATLERFGRELARIPSKEVQFARLQRKTQVVEEIYTLLQTRLKEAEIAEAVADPTVRVVDPAIAPTRPIKPRRGLNLALGAVLGLILGCALAFVREMMDRTVHTREDVQGASGLPVLGLIPRIRASGAAYARRSALASRLTRFTPWAQGAGAEAQASLETRLLSGRDPRNPVSEAYRALRTNITFLDPDRPLRALVFTSPMPGDGKSTTAANLAITLAQQGTRVLLVDADMRRGLLQSVFETSREPGLSNVLLGAVPAEGAIRSVTPGEGSAFDFLPTGTLPPNPAELLGSARMRELLARLRERYDTVILDAPPLNLVTDAAVLGTVADGVVVVARASSTEHAGLAYTVEQLRQVRAPVLGVVLNDVDFRRDMRYYGSYAQYAYEYSYGGKG